MHTPDLDADYGIAQALREGTKLLMAFLEAGPSPPRRLREQLFDAAFELQRLGSADGGAFPAGRKVAAEFYAWTVRCMAAGPSPDKLEDDDYGTR